MSRWEVGRGRDPDGDEHVLVTFDGEDVFVLSQGSALKLAEKLIRHARLAVYEERKRKERGE